MGIKINFVIYDGSGQDKITTRELSEHAEQKYLRQFREESAEYVKEAEYLADPAKLLFWTEADEIILEQAKKVRERRERVMYQLTGYQHKLNQQNCTHQPLTPELVEERRAAMLEAAQIHRDNLQHFAGEIAKDYEKAIEALEQRAEALSVYEGITSPTRYA